MDRNQSARRNAEDNWLAYQQGKQYREMKQAHGGDRGNQYTVASGHVSGKDDHLPKTAEKIAAGSGVKPITIRRNAAFSDAVDVLIADGAPQAG